MKSAIAKTFAAAVFVGVFLSACGESRAPSTKTDAGGASESLTIYTGRDKDEVAAVVAMFEQKYPAYKGNVRAVTLGAQEALDRLRAEKTNPQAGFLWGGTQQGLQQAANEGLLASSSPANANLFDPSRRDPQGRWYAEM